MNKTKLEEIKLQLFATSGKFRNDREALWQLVEQSLEEYADWKIKECFYEGRLKELAILEAHINEQIYQTTINTESLLKYIDTAREVILSNKDKK